MPTLIVVRFGAGYEPATALMPVLAMPPRAILVHEPMGTHRNPPVPLTGKDSGEVAAETIAATIRRHDRGAALALASVEALDAGLIAQPWTNRELQLQSRFVLLASAGRLDEAAALLEGHSSTATGAQLPRFAGSTTRPDGGSPRVGRASRPRRKP